MDEQTLKEQFDALTEQKKALWEQIKDKTDNYEYEQTPEWMQIRELDVQLVALDAQIKGGN